MKSSKISSLYRAATIYGIPYISLQNRNNGALSRAQMNLTKKKLVDTEEEVLVQRILSLDKRGFLSRPATI